MRSASMSAAWMFPGMAGKALRALSRRGGEAARVNWCKCDVLHFTLEVESFAVRDLESATFAQVSRKRGFTMSSSAVQGQFLWHELLTPDPAAGAGFYSKAFGWTAQPWEGDANYTMLAHEKGPVG